MQCRKKTKKVSLCINVHTNLRLDRIARVGKIMNKKDRWDSGRAHHPQIVFLQIVLCDIQINVLPCTGTDLLQLKT